MKIGGQEVGAPEDVLVLPRTPEPVVFRARGLSDFSRFEELVPRPQMPKKQVKGGKVVDDSDAPAYVAAMEMYNQKKLAYLVIESLAPSEIEWQTIEADKPSTWVNWTTELKEAGFTDIECNRILNLVLGANCLDEDKLKAARESFLHGRPKD